MEQPIQQPQIDLKNTTGIKTTDDTSVFQQGVLLRKVSKFVTGTSEDAMLPIPVFYEASTGKILTDVADLNYDNLEMREALGKAMFYWVKEINTKKSPIDSFSTEDWDQWNSYVVHRVLSMNPDYLSLVNEVQKLPPDNKKQIYSIYKEYIPKNNKWSKYVKSTEIMMKI